MGFHLAEQINSSLCFSYESFFSKTFGSLVRDRPSSLAQWLLPHIESHAGVHGLKMLQNFAKVRLTVHRQVHG